jgi:hypothetical protein
MIKEIFDIEPKQKNVLIILVGIFGLSFLQLYLFKPSIFELSIFFSLGISLGLTVCWSALNIPSLILCFYVMTGGANEKNSEKYNYNLIIFTLGLLAIGWISLLTYIGYEFNFTFMYLFRLAVLMTIIRIIFWYIFGTILDRKTKK